MSISLTIFISKHYLYLFAQDVSNMTLFFFIYTFWYYHILLQILPDRWEPANIFYHQNIHLFLVIQLFNVNSPFCRNEYKSNLGDHMTTLRKKGDKSSSLRESKRPGYKYCSSDDPQVTINILIWHDRSFNKNMYLEFPDYKGYCAWYFYSFLLFANQLFICKLIILRFTFKQNMSRRYEVIRYLNLCFHVFKLK